MYCLKLLLLLGVVFMAACSSPAKRYDDMAWESGFERSVVVSPTFSHVTYRRSSGAERLHVYLEGDGVPWWTRYIVARDPTPRRPLMMGLMAQDMNDTFYLTRPCYNGYAQSQACNNLLWTSKRYSPVIVNSMTRVLKEYVVQERYKEVVLIGHSGGGSLAMLLAEQLPQTVAVLTVTGNMDIEAWTKLHDYSPLYGSLNPASRPPLPEYIWQLHLAGAMDRNVPPSIVQGAVKQQTQANVLIFGKFDHLCCWQKAWQDVLMALERRDVTLLKNKYVLP